MQDFFGFLFSFSTSTWFTIDCWNVYLKFTYGVYSPSASDLCFVLFFSSEDQIPENFKVVNHIRDLIFSLQGSSIWCTPSAICCTMGSPSCLVSLSTQTYILRTFFLKSPHEASYSALSFPSLIYIQEVQVLGIFIIA